MTMDIATALMWVQAYAIDNYEDGWDVVVEIMPEAELLAHLKEAGGNVETCIAAIQKYVVDLWVEQHQNCWSGEGRRPYDHVNTSLT